MTCRHTPEPKSHNRTDRSSLALATKRPSELQATAHTLLAWPLNSNSVRASWMFHARTKPSSFAARRRERSGEKARDQVLFEYPCSVITHSHVSMFHTRTAPSSLPVASVRLTG